MDNQVAVKKTITLSLIGSGSASAPPAQHLCDNGLGVAGLVIVKAPSSNTGNVYIGGKRRQAFILSPGEEVQIPIDSITGVYARFLREEDSVEWAVYG